MKVAVTTLAFCVAALLALGLVMVYSASLALVNAHTHAEVGAHLLKMQLIWCALGLVACAVTAILDYAILKKLALADFHLRAGFGRNGFSAEFWAENLRYEAQRCAPVDSYSGRWQHPALRTRQDRAHHHARVVLRPFTTKNGHVQARNFFSGNHHRSGARSSFCRA